MDFNFDIEKIKWVKGHRNMPEAHYIFKVPSVTAIISEFVPDPEYEQWVAKMGQEQVDKIMISAAQRGTSFHFFLENFIFKYAETKDVSEALKYTQIESPKKLLLDEIPPDKIEEGRDLFYKFYYSDYSNKYLDVLGIELAIYSPLHFYRGKLDILFKDSIYGLSLTDFKSSSSKIVPGSTKEYKYKLQLGAYANAIDEMYASKNIVVNNASILCVNKKSDILDETSCNGDELKKYKEEFKTFAREYHIKYGQQFLVT